MATEELAQRWKAIGGTTEAPTGAKAKGSDVAKLIFVSPNGDKLKSWKQASAFLTEHKANEVKQQAEPAKRAADAEPQDEGDGNKENQKKTKKPRVEPAAKAAAAGAKAPASASAKAAAAAGAKTPVAAAAVKAEAPEAAAAAAAVGSGRRAAQGGKVYKEVLAGRVGKGDKVIKTEEPTADSEAAALLDTGGGKGPVKRRLLDFSVVDASGQMQSLERIKLLPGAFSISGVVQPAEGEVSKEDGRRVTAIGPITDWRVVYSKAQTQVVIHTALGHYTVGRPTATYRKAYAGLEEQLLICHQVYIALTVDAGGNMQASLEEVAAKLARAKVGKGYGSAREALLLNARFVLAQLDSMSVQVAGSAGATGAAVGKSKVAYAHTAFGTALAAEVAKGPVVSSLMSNSIKIVEPRAADAPDLMKVDALVEADEDMARRLQAKMDAKEHAARSGGGGRVTSGKAYIRISEDEIADDYPAPLQYDVTEEEVDELVLADEDSMDIAPEDLPRRLLTDFAVYNSEGLFSSLELLPMWGGTDPDTELFASGVMTEDEGDWVTGGQAAGGDDQAGSAGGSGSGSGAAEGAAAAPAVPAVPAGGGGMRLYLSQIREWMVEFSCDLIFISLRTDVAWYRLVTPLAKYAPWFRTVLKSAQVAVSVIGMLSEEVRASRLSFNDVVKRLAEQAEQSATYISKKVDTVERFVVVHGQILLNQITNYPNKAVQRSAFVTLLRQKMESRRHSKLYMGKAKVLKGAKARNANPMKGRVAAGRPKPMNATATTMVKAVWQSYFIHNEKAAAAALAAANNEPIAKEVEEDANAEEDEAAEENALAPAVTAAAPRSAGKRSKAKKPTQQKVQWVGAGTADAGGRTVYSTVKLASGVQLTCGQVVAFEVEEDVLAEHAAAVKKAAESAAAGADAAEELAAPLPALGLVQCLYEDSDGDKMLQVRRMLRGPETVLGDAGGEHELYCTNDYEARPVSEVTVKVLASRMTRPWGAAHRIAAFRAMEELRVLNEAARARGDIAAVQYEYRTLYLPEDGMFKALEKDLKTGAYREDPAVPVALGVTSAGGLIKAGVTYAVGDFMFLHPEAWTGACGEEEDEAEEKEGPAVPSYVKNGRHKGSNRGLKAFRVGQLIKVDSRSKDNLPATIMVRPFLRPEDCSADSAYGSAWWELYSLPEKHAAWAGLEEIDVGDVVSKCSVLLTGAGGGRIAVQPHQNGLEMDTFVCTRSYDPTKSAFSTAPASLRVGGAAATGKAAAGKGKAASGKASATSEDVEMVEASAKGKGKAADKGKGKGPASAAADVATTSSAAHEEEDEAEEPSEVSMRAMDIFAGCGGLSEGMHQAGVATSLWAIEYEQPAADAFQLNNPDTKVFCNNCNVLLQAAMNKAGLADDCDACDDAVEAAGKLSAEDLAALPLPGEVEFMMGGPPCQGYSGMNRFNKGNWSMVQNSMVMAYLSYCDFYRPRYFLLENVRNFVSHNKSFTFRLTLRTLLEMGYQVRFGVLNAGNFGVPQSRKRTIIWAAAPDEQLPSWPAPRHVFHSPQLRINLPNGVQYCAVPDLPGAPLRAVTVRDAICDLPVIENGAAKAEISFGGKPTSAFQKFIRGTTTVLQDHICKEMNELNLERCRCIPKNVPGADWRVLQEIVAADPSREKFKGQPLVPWCLPNTADRNNGWRGLFGRLDLSGHFPTSTTDPQPMGKVGQVFHPTQDRIVSVRECARAQGFPDRFLFSGNVHSRHRQVGNAVPPPLAAALGGRLRIVLEQQRTEQVQRTMLAQFGGAAMAPSGSKK